MTTNELAALYTAIENVRHDRATISEVYSIAANLFYGDSSDDYRTWEPFQWTMICAVYAITMQVTDGRASVQYGTKRLLWMFGGA